jgi:aspartyl-tRNA(Asn)/glutamyl-tRNA(Gln) amidotransferase subunit C
VAVTHEDVKHIAQLARLAVNENKLDNLVAQLNGILEHMDVLQKVDTSGVGFTGSGISGGTPLREDSGPPISLASPLQSFAPEELDGFILVPRLATHGDILSNTP